MPKIYPGCALASLTLKSKLAGKREEKEAFAQFLKLLMGELAAGFIAAFKATNRPLLNNVPGTGEIKLTEPGRIDPSTADRLKYLIGSLNDSDIKDCINNASAQASVWHPDPDGGYVYECYVRASTLSTQDGVLKYQFITGSRESRG